MTSFATHLECSRCQEDFPVDQIQQVCKSDGGPLLVRYDLRRVRESVTKEALRDRPELDCHMLLTVHDELVFEVPESEQTDAGALVKREMEGVISLRVPLVVTIGAGKNWIDAKG